MTSDNVLRPTAKRTGVLWRRCCLTILLLTVLRIEANDQPNEIDPRWKVFAVQKQHQLEELAKREHLTVPPDAREFFRAVEADDQGVVSNRYATLRGLTNVLFAPIQETMGAYEQFHAWNGVMLRKFSDGVLHSIPDGSIYFGGTDYGRFVITAVRDVEQSPNIFILTPKFMSAPNALVITSYIDYLRLTYGDRLWVPAETNVEAVVQQYIADIQNREEHGETLGTDDSVIKDKDGRPQVKGVQGVMNINGIITKMIFDNNKARHDFYIEESYVIPWMYPYLEPHGLILKLNKEPLAQLDPAVVARDKQYWATLTKEMVADPRFLENEQARKAFSKLRSAIGGVYSHRHMTNDAEAAFMEALELCPTSPEAVFRLAQLYVENGRFDNAIAVFQQLHDNSHLTDNEKQRMVEAIAQVQDLQRQHTSHLK
jgi:hypothetical protein